MTVNTIGSVEGWTHIVERLEAQSRSSTGWNGLSSGVSMKIASNTSAGPVTAAGMK